MTIAELVEKKSELIELKKSAIKHSDPARIIDLKVIDPTNKEIRIDGYDGLQKVVMNTYYWMDSHDDVHVKSTFKKSIKERKKKIFHLDNHDSSRGFASKVGNTKDIFEVSVPWSAFSIEKEGQTIAVIGVSDLIEEYNKQVYDAYQAGEIDQHSIGMLYDKLRLAVNDEEYEEEFKNWNEIFPLLGNPERALNKGYFWIVDEAILKEFSCLLWDGSNSLTPSVKEDIEPSKDTQEQKTEAVNPAEYTSVKRRRIN